MIVKEVKYSRNYILELTFTNNKVKRLNFRKFLMTSDNPIITKYRDLVLFQQVEIIYGTLSWNEEMDFSPESLYNWNDNERAHKITKSELKRFGITV
jgi:hypothetical protein